MEQITNQSNTPLIKQTLPNSTGVLVLGILSIVFCWCYGFVGIVLGIVALAISAKSLKMYEDNPDKWMGYNNLRAGRITAIVGLSLSAITIIVFILVVLKEGMGFGYDFWDDFY